MKKGEYKMQDIDDWYMSEYDHIQDLGFLKKGNNKEKYINIDI